MARTRRVALDPAYVYPDWPVRQMVLDVDERDYSPAEVALSFADAVREARARVGWSQVELAVQSGLSEFTIVRLESGRVWPDLHTVGRLSGALGLDVRISQH
jgi:ribosome-binding protein aMBF1 (putative translation factor)